MIFTPLILGEGDSKMTPLAWLQIVIAILGAQFALLSFFFIKLLSMAKDVTEIKVQFQMFHDADNFTCSFAKQMKERETWLKENQEKSGGKLVRLSPRKDEPI